MPSYTVKLNFNDGTHNYDLPVVTSISDPKEGIKATIIPGNRADGSIIIPGGKRSQTITVKGVLVNHLGYESLTTDMNTLRTDVSTSVATLTLKHYTGSAWQVDWAYTVRRVNEIVFPESLRIDSQEYQIEFLVLSY